MHFTAERSPFYSQLATAEENAKTTKLNMWANYEEPKAVEVVDDTSERQCTYEQVGFFSVAMTNWPLTNSKFVKFILCCDFVQSYLLGNYIFDQNFDSLVTILINVYCKSDSGTFARV